MKMFYEYTFNNEQIILHKDAVIKIQSGKGKGSYVTRMCFIASDFGRAVYHYNSLNVGNGFKKRLYCDSLNKKTLHKILT